MSTQLSEEGFRIGRRLRATGKLLLGGAEKQVKDYQTRFKGLDNVPVFVSADNSENEIKRHLESIKKRAKPKPKSAVA